MMKVALFCIPVTGDSALEEELNALIASGTLISLTEEIQPVHGNPCWCFCVKYQPLEPGKKTGKKPEKRETGEIDYREILTPEEFKIYDELRRLRKDIAKRDDIAHYIVCTNKHLAEMVQKRCRTLAMLRTIPGFGESKVEKYGEGFLAILTQYFHEGEQNEASGRSYGTDCRS